MVATAGGRLITDINLSDHANFDLVVGDTRTRIRGLWVSDLFEIFLPSKVYPISKEKRRMRQRE